MALAAMCSNMSIPFPDLSGATFNFLEASLVSGIDQFVPEYAYANHAAVNVVDASFCNVTMAYSHVGQHDEVNVQVWLPTGNWNQKMMGLGGGGFSAGLYDMNFLSMMGAIGEGYVAVSTDAGHNRAQELEDWLLTPSGEVNHHLLEDFASVALNDLSIVGKMVAESFYGEPPRYSYWSGCSQGGRQGLMLAQKYPHAFDGIVASAPAINWGEILPAAVWGYFLTIKERAIPKSCELDHITHAAVSFCDGMDGVRDGIVSNIDACNFNPFTLVGRPILCNGEPTEISKVAALMAFAAWNGPVSNTIMSLWPGVQPAANLTSLLSLAVSECPRNSDKQPCIGMPVAFGTDWIRLAVKKDPNFNLTLLTHKEYVKIFHQSVEEYTSIIGTNNPDLSEFRKRGGKMLTFHGLADPMISFSGTRRYYETVIEQDPDVKDFYRLFEAPGLGHCWSAEGLYPSTIFNDMVAWVEEGRVPETLPVNFIHDGVKYERMLCPYPGRAIYKGHGDPKRKESYFCLDSDNHGWW